MTKNNKDLNKKELFDVIDNYIDSKNCNFKNSYIPNEIKKELKTEYYKIKQQNLEKKLNT